jgi:hypothetical protein
MDGRGAIERVGGWETVRGALLAAALIAVPVAPSLAAVLGRWIPAADQPLAVAAQAGLGSLLLAAWFLHGARSLLRQVALAGGGPGSSPARAPAGIAAGRAAGPSRRAARPDRRRRGWPGRLTAPPAQTPRGAGGR